jgi:hypothetical protein
MSARRGRSMADPPAVPLVAWLSTHAGSEAPVSKLGGVGQLRRDSLVSMTARRSGSLMRLCECSALSLLRKARRSGALTIHMHVGGAPPHALNAEPEARFDGPDDL